MDKMKKISDLSVFSPEGAALIQKSQIFDDGRVVDQIITDQYALYNADTCAAILNIPDNSVGFSVFSSPFDSLYTYSNLLEDMGNSAPGQFAKHFDFIIPHLLRITKPGRNLSFHCMNWPRSKTRDGYIGLRDFRGELIAAFEKHGWIFHSEVCVWKDPVTAMHRTKAMGLLHKQVRKDSAMSRQGVPDYLITMRKEGVNDSPITHEYGFAEYEGTNPPNCDDDIWQTDLKGKKTRPNGYKQIAQSDGRWPVTNPFPKGSDAAVVWSIAVWQRYASPVWMDIQPSGKIAGTEKSATLQSVKDEGDTRHICPLQLQVISRAIHLWSNPNDVVFTPFLGIGSEVYEAVRLGRRGVGIELKGAYFEMAKKNLDALNDKMREEFLFK